MRHTAFISLRVTGVYLRAFMCVHGRRGSEGSVKFFFSIPKRIAAPDEMYMGGTSGKEDTSYAEQWKRKISPPKRKKAEKRHKFLRNR